MTRCCVFLGPSLPRAEAEALLPGIEVLPPAVLGDVYALARRGEVDRIALIDGRFESTPAVWHKELLFALAQGIRVFGASSMGALRAAELHPYGMEGVGAVFADYRNGVLEDDDEVALVHGPAQTGYACISIAMVNVRHALGAAREAGLLDAAAATTMLAQLKTLHYAARTWTAVEAAARSHGVAAVAELMLFLRSPERDLKRRDAIELLCRLGQELPPPPAAPAFERTLIWKEFVERRESVGALPPASGTGTDDLVRHCLLHAVAMADEGHEAWMRVLEKKLAERMGIEPGLEEVQAALNALRVVLQCTSPEAMDARLREHGLERADLVAWAHDDALQLRLRTMLRSHLPHAVVSTLQRRGKLKALCECIETLRTRCAPQDFDPTRLTRSEAEQVWSSYQRRIDGGAGTLDEHARRRGFCDAGEFAQALLLDYRMQAAAAPV